MKLFITRAAVVLLLLLGQFSAAFSQLTIKVTAIPANTPPGSNIHVVGTFNNWNPGDATKILTPLGGGQFQIVLTPPVGQVKFKFTRGSWSTVEGNASGGFLPDRVLNYNGQPTTVNLSILSWEGQGGGSGTAAPNVQILDNAFSIPELNRTRRIWLYLPPDYHTSTKNYPVLYMHDGQNLFNEQTSFSGEWKIDESLNQLFTQGDYGCIVVGIDNGGQYRLDEYSPWVNSQYNAGGQGDEYVDFLVNTLKPFIDMNYRTLPGRLSTGIAGSSMGGLISMYALSERQDVFSKAGVFSPAFWFGGNNSVNHTASHTKQGPAKVYFLAGADEENDGNQSNYVVNDMNAVANAMSTAGFLNAEKLTEVPSDGKHSEWFWAREFPDAYVWLFAGAVTGSQENSPARQLEIYPNPAGEWVRFSGANSDETLYLKIFNSSGKLIRNTTIVGNEPVWTGDLPKGVYVVKARNKGGKWIVGKLVR
jgi:predicted alpha/beta superfamily hydrolase